MSALEINDEGVNIDYADTTISYEFLEQQMKENTILLDKNIDEGGEVTEKHHHNIYKVDKDDSESYTIKRVNLFLTLEV
jgi:hypothetical protein